MLDILAPLGGKLLDAEAGADKLQRDRDPLTPTPLPDGERGENKTPLPVGERGRGEGRAFFRADVDAADAAFVR